MDLSGSTIFATGGTGSFGSALIDYLQGSGAKFIVYSRDESKQFDMYVERRDKNITYIVGDVRDKQKLIYSMQGVDYVIHCVTPNTRILTGDGAKVIADLKVGSLVLTGNGKFKEITSVKMRYIDEDIVKILPYMTNIPTEITKEHPLLVWSPPRRCAYSSRSWCNPACNKKYNCQKYHLGITPQMKEAGKIKVGDFIMYPRIKGSTTSMDIRFCKLLGYYVAEGSLGGKKKGVYYTTRFSLNINEEENILEIDRLCFELYGKRPSRDRNGNEVTLVLCGVNIAKQFQIGGIGARYKRVPEAVMNEDNEHIKSFLSGYFNGDGCKYNGKMSTVSETLAYQLRLLFAKIGVCVGFHLYVRGTSIIGDRICKRLPSYSLEISKLAEISELQLNWEKATNHSRHFIDDDYIYVQVRKVETVRYSGYVYNLSVEEDETYVSNYITVHNCAALKQVPTGEKFPEEVINTNILGTKNVIEAAEYCGVKRVVFLSTDKAAFPIGAYGMSKALAEKVVTAHVGKTVNVCLRYGNVLGSRGSVVPLFFRLIKQGLPITITNPTMTRFILTLEEAVKIALKCLRDGKQGELFIMKPPACTIKTLVEALELHFGREFEKTIIGIRPGEKMHEVLLTGAEVYRAITEQENDITYARIMSQQPIDYFFCGEDYVEPEAFSSNNAEQYNAEQVLSKLKEAILL